MSTSKIETDLSDCKENFDDLYALLCLSAHKHLQNLELSERIVQEVYLDVVKDEITFKNENIATRYFYNTVEIKCKAYIRNNTIVQLRVISKSELQEIEKHFMTKEDVIIVNPKLIEMALNTLPIDLANKMRISIGDYSSK
ncbi:MAG: hypothetical protein V3U92_03395 [Cellulophaga sp.]